MMAMTQDEPRVQSDRTLPKPHYTQDGRSIIVIFYKVSVNEGAAGMNGTMPVPFIGGG